jgi:hypothetical protein
MRPRGGAADNPAPRLADDEMAAETGAIRFFPPRRDGKSNNQVGWRRTGSQTVSWTGCNGIGVCFIHYPLDFPLCEGQGEIPAR